MCITNELNEKQIKRHAKDATSHAMFKTNGF